jgi:hypothetical protein
MATRFILGSSIVILACTTGENATDADVSAGNSRKSLAADTSLTDCGLRPASVLTGRGIGDVRVGASVNQLRAGCRVVRDTTLQFGNEGMPERRVTVALGTDSLDATIVDDHVWRIEVRTPRFRTADSLGVGSIVRDIRRGPTTLATGDRGVFALRRDHCGLSFQLAGVPPGRGENWSRIPVTTRVALVLVFGCQESESESRL